MILVGLFQLKIFYGSVIWICVTMVNLSPAYSAWKYKAYISNI